MLPSYAQVCKTLADMTRERSVWDRVLQRSCSELGIFRPTYPRDHMTVTDLEHAATAPYRFIHLLRTELVPSDGDVDVEPKYTQTLVISESGNIRSAYIIAGGRYMVTAVGTGVLQLWDLGYKANTQISPLPLASLTLSDFWGIGDRRTTEDGDGINIVTIHEAIPT